MLVLFWNVWFYLKNYFNYFINWWDLKKKLKCEWFLIWYCFYVILNDVKCLKLVWWI